VAAGGRRTRPAQPSVVEQAETIVAETPAHTPTWQDAIAQLAQVQTLALTSMHEEIAELRTYVERAVTN
jgi:hypothetical protein